MPLYYITKEGRNGEYAALLDYKKNEQAFLCFLSSRHASILSPYSKTVPAIIAKASTIYNPFIYAIIHNKYR